MKCVRNKTHSNNTHSVARILVNEILCHKLLADTITKTTMSPTLTVSTQIEIAATPAAVRSVVRVYLMYSGQRVNKGTKYVNIEDCF